MPATGIFIVAALVFAWISDGPLKGRRWPLIPVGAVITVRFLDFPSTLQPTKSVHQIIIAAILLKLPLYGHNKAHFALYYLIQLGGGCGAFTIPTHFSHRELPLMTSFTRPCDFGMLLRVPSLG